MNFVLIRSETKETKRQILKDTNEDNIKYYALS